MDKRDGSGTECLLPYCRRRQVRRQWHSLADTAAQLPAEPARRIRGAVLTSSSRCFFAVFLPLSWFWIICRWRDTSSAREDMLADSMMVACELL